MTVLKLGKPLKRVTAFRIHGQPVVVELSSHTLRLREKGTRHFYEIDYESIYHLAAKKATAARPVFGGRR